MSATAHRGWLVAALVLAVALLVGSIAVVATWSGRPASADVPRWGMSQGWGSDRLGPEVRDGTRTRGGRGMMDGTGWADRADLRDDCLDLARAGEGR